jgi:hypothetical protein
MISTFAKDESSIIDSQNCFDAGNNKNITVEKT